MEFSIKSGRPEKQRAACVVVGVFQSRRLSTAAAQLDAASEGYLSNLLRRGDMEGKLGQTLLLHQVPGQGSERILLVGCGRERNFNDHAFREVQAQALAALKETGTTEAINYLTELPLKGRNIYWTVRQSVEVVVKALYKFENFKSPKDAPRRALRRITWMVPTRRDMATALRAVEEGQAIAQACALARNLGNTPPNICTPAYLAQQAELLSQQYPTKVSVAVLEESDMAELGMGAFLAISQGSNHPGKLISLHYAGTDTTQAPIVLVGKGVTFDTGGQPMKPLSGMLGMKYDMCGAAAVMGAIQAAAALKLPLHIIGILATAENMPGPKAARPDDIVRTMSGITVEIRNPDAEGRLLLCDALTYCERYNPAVVIDVATLTGGCIIALGAEASGLMGNHNPLLNDLIAAGESTGDRVWQLPLWEEYGNGLKSPHADLANVGGEPRAIVAGCFLSNFTKKYHWAHVDIAGTASVNDGPKRGATGRPVPLLVQYLLDRCPA